MAEVRALDRSGVRIWLHAASVGEVQLARAMINELARLMPGAEFVISTVTVQGRQMARKMLGPEIRCIYAPFDLPGVVERTIETLAPSVYICLETELWPNVLRALARRRVKLILLNGRLSERSYHRYRLVRGFIKEVLAQFARIAVISPGDGERYIGLGAEPARVVVAGNAKYDLAVSDSNGTAAEHYRKLLGLSEGQPLLVAGSTHTGEEKMLLEVFDRLRSDAGLEDLVWVVAPRHLNRLPEVEEMLARLGVPFERLSAVRKNGRQSSVVLVDTVGELAGLYSVATYVFCGGSLVERGGHNIMEAAVYGKPVYYGPSMKDFADAANLLESVGGGFQVADQHELIARIRELAARPDEYEAICRRVREAVMAQQGSAGRQAAMVVDLLAA